MFKYLVLGFLRDRRPHHGYALAKTYSEQSGTEISTGRFYRELQRLVDEDLIHTVANPANADPRRSPYEITDNGCLGFDTWLTQSGELGPTYPQDAISARALFLRDAEPRFVAMLLASWKEQLWLRCVDLERDRDEARARRLDVLAVLLERRRKYATADLDLVEALQRLLITSPQAKMSEPTPSPESTLAPLGRCHELDLTSSCLEDDGETREV